MRFTPALFAGVAAAGIYWPEASSSTTSTSSTKAWPVKATSSSAWVDPGYWPKPSSSSSSSSVSKKGWKTTTKYETECWTVTSSSSTKVWTSIKAIPTVCEDDETWPIPTTSSKSTPAAPVKPTGTWADPPYCSAYTETCTVTVTASATGAWGSPVVKPTTPAAPVYTSTASWAAGAAKPSGTGAWTSPYAAQFTGAASAQKAGALLAGAGAVAAMLL